MRILTRMWASESIGRTKAVTVVLPSAYSPVGRPFPVLYLLHGHGGNRHTWLRSVDIAAQAADGRLIMVFPECGRFWFINDMAGRRYEDYLVHEVVTHIDQHFNTVRHRSGRAIAGFSMGGASALFQALRHGGLFSVVGSNSGAFEAPLRVGDPYHGHRGDSRLAIPTVRDHERVWGPVGSAVRRAYDPYRLVGARDRSRPLSVYLDVGTADFDRMIAMNRNMRDALVAARVDHEYRERAGGHDWSFVSAGAPALFGFVRRKIAES